MNFIYEFISARIVNAIGWTILHSLWQGVILAIILMALLYTMGNYNSKIRYALSVAFMITFFVSIIVTFSIYNSAEKPTIDTLVFADSSVQAGAEQDNANSTQPINNINVITEVGQFLEHNLSTIVFAWIIGLTIFTFRFIGGVLYVQRISRNGLSELDIEWFYRARELSKKLSINKFIYVYESVNVKIPVAIGYLKPIILLPIGMINSLPYTQVEAIIAHELAHIKRYDYLVNFIQTFAETLFFFNPAMWFISSQIRNERENCCDDLALDVCGDSITYSKALYNLQQINDVQHSLVLPAKGKLNQLYRRIKRMNGERKNMSRTGRLAVFSAMFLFVTALLIFSTTSASEPSAINKASFINPFSFESNTNSEKHLNSFKISLPDSSLNKGKRTLKFSAKDNGEEKRFKAKLNNGKIETLYVDGDKIEDKDIPKYESLVNQKKKEYEEAMLEYNKSMEKYSQSMKGYKESMKAFREKMKNFSGSKHYNMDFEIPDVDHIVSEALASVDFDRIGDEVSSSLERHHSRKEIHIPPIHIPKINIPPIHIPKIVIPPVHVSKFHMDDEDYDFEFDRKELEEWKKEFKESMKDFKIDMEELKRDLNSEFNSEEFKKEMKEWKHENLGLKKGMEKLHVSMDKLKVEMKSLKNFINDVKDELVADKVISDTDDFEDLDLNKDSMEVNGKRQSGELHKKYLELYKKHYGKELKKSFSIHN